MVIVVDFLDVNRIMYPHSISQGYCFRTIEVFFAQRKRKSMEILNKVKMMLNLYQLQQLQRVQIDTDKEFKRLGNDLLILA